MTRYARYVDRLRWLVILILFVSVMCSCLVGLILGHSYSLELFEWVGRILLVAKIAFFAAVPLLIEFIVRSYFEIRPNRLRKFQFTILELLAATSLVALVLSSYKFLDDLFVPLGFAALFIAAYLLELRRWISRPTIRNRGRDTTGSPSGQSAETATDSKAAQADCDSA